MSAVAQLDWMGKERKLMRTVAQSPDLVRLGRYVRARRRELGLTQTDLAERLGYVQERISLLENGKYGLPSVTSLKALADALQVTLAVVLREADIPVGEVAFWQSTDPAAPALSIPGHDRRNDGHHLAAECNRLRAEMEGTEQRVSALEQRMLAADALREQLTDRRRALEQIAAALSRRAAANRPG